MTIKNERRRKVLSFVLSFAMVVGMMPAFNMTVYADSATEHTDVKGFGLFDGQVRAYDSSNGGVDFNNGDVVRETSELIFTQDADSIKNYKVICPGNTEFSAEELMASQTVSLSSSKKYTVSWSGTDLITVTVAEYASTPTNDYTITIPATTTMNSDGTATALTNGLKLEGSNWQNDYCYVNVHMSTSTNEWKLTSTTTSDTIGFGVYSDADGSTPFSNNKVKFTKTEAYATGGTTKQLYAKPDATDFANADDATYTASIVFTVEFVIPD